MAIKPIPQKQIRQTETLQTELSIDINENFTLDSCRLKKNIFYVFFPRSSTTDNVVS